MKQLRLPRPSQASVLFLTVLKPSLTLGGSFYNYRDDAIWSGQRGRWTPRSWWHTFCSSDSYHSLTHQYSPIPRCTRIILISLFLVLRPSISTRAEFSDSMNNRYILYQPSSSNYDFIYDPIKPKHSSSLWSSPIAFIPLMIRFADGGDPRNGSFQADNQLVTSMLEMLNSLASSEAQPTLFSYVVNLAGRDWAETNGLDSRALETFSRFPQTDDHIETRFWYRKETGEYPSWVGRCK